MITNYLIKLYNDNIFNFVAQRRERYLYFHALASNTENRVPLSVMNNETAWLQSVESLPREFQTIGKRHTQAIAQAMDRNGNLFFGVEDPIGVACWDTDRPYSRENIKVVVQDSQTLQFASGLKVEKIEILEIELETIFLIIYHSH